MRQETEDRAFLNLRPGGSKSRGAPGVVSSYVEVEIQPGILSILERAGDGKIEEIAALLRSYGLCLKVRVDSPCG